MRSLALLLAFLASPALADDFTYTTTDANELAGVEYARQLYCASQPQTDAQGNSIACSTPDAQSYWQFVASSAFASYALQKLRADAQAQADAAIAAQVGAINSRLASPAH